MSRTGRLIGDSMAVALFWWRSKGGAVDFSLLHAGHSRSELEDMMTRGTLVVVRRVYILRAAAASARLARVGGRNMEQSRHIDIHGHSQRHVFARSPAAVRDLCRRPASTRFRPRRRSPASSTGSTATPTAASPMPSARRTSRCSIATGGARGRRGRPSMASAHPPCRSSPKRGLTHRIDASVPAGGRSPAARRWIRTSRS